MWQLAAVLILLLLDNGRSFRAYSISRNPLQAGTITRLHSIKPSAVQNSSSGKTKIAVIIAARLVSIFVSGSPVGAADLKSELQSYDVQTESIRRQEERDPKTVMKAIKNKINTYRRLNKEVNKEIISNAQERVLTLKAYLDEAERDLFERNWENLEVYLYTFAEQNDAFATLIQGLFPSDNELDKSARDAMSFEAQTMFLALDDLREAAVNKNFKDAQNVYTKLLLSYDRFLKAGDLYPTYDAITSTEIFFEGIPKSSLKFDSNSKVQVLDEVVLVKGPDMGKTGTVINIDGKNAVVKLDSDGKAYQEVKYVRFNMLAKAEAETSTKNTKKTQKVGQKYLRE